MMGQIKYKIIDPEIVEGVITLGEYLPRVGEAVILGRKNFKVYQVLFKEQGGVLQPILLLTER